MFGRGRGRGAPPPGARLRDDDGNHIALNTHAAPPELFPPIGRPLPPLPALTARDEDLLARKRQLDAHWRSSCFNLPLPSATPGVPDGDDAQLERYSDRVRRAQAPPRRVLLHEVVGRLESRYFPRELWATKRTRGGGGGGGAARSLPTGGDIDRLDRLADAEQRAVARGDDDDELGGAAGDDEGGLTDRRGHNRKRTRLDTGVGNIDDDDDDAPAGQRGHHREGGEEEEVDDEGPEDDADDDGYREPFDDDDGYEDGSAGGGDEDGAVYQ